MSTETIVLSVAVAVAAGLVGCFAVMRRMVLAADPLSHVALPGIGIALALHIHPIIGAAAMLFFGALLVWALEERARASTEAVIGVIFSLALALGSLVATGENLIAALFGGTGGILTLGETALGCALAAAIIGFVVVERNALVIALVSPDVARTAGVNLRRLNLLYMEVFALTIALGLRYLGVLLMGALIIIPAVTAKRLARNLTMMLLLSAGIAVVSTVGGTVLAIQMHRETGPLIVSVAAACFLLSLAGAPSS